MTQEGYLDIDGVNVFSTTDNQIIDTTQDNRVSFGVDKTVISGLVPSISGESRAIELITSRFDETSLRYPLMTVGELTSMCPRGEIRKSTPGRGFPTPGLQGPSGPIGLCTDLRARFCRTVGG